MLTAIEIYPDEDPITAETVSIVFRGTLNATGTPFVTEVQEVELEDIASTVQATLVDNYIEWGVVNDVS